MPRRFGSARMTTMDFRSILVVLCVVLGGLDASERRKSRSRCYEGHVDSAKSFHDFKTRDLDGKNVPMSAFSGHVVLAVNVATF